MVANKYSFKSVAVQSTRMPYSFQQGAAAPYSFRQPVVENAVMLGMITKKSVIKLGSVNKMVETEPVTAEAPVSPAADEDIVNPTRRQTT